MDSRFLSEVRMSEPVLDFTFEHRWQAEVLPSRPLILPRRQYVYPRHAEEVERGALEVLVRPATGEPFRAYRTLELS
jgi:hypothetical protein